MKKNFIFLRRLLWVTQKTTKLFKAKVSVLLILTFSITNVYSQAVTVFSQNFDNATSTEPWGNSVGRGWFKNAQLTTVSGKGKVLQFNFQEGSLGSSDGCGDYKLYLDSLYRELYFSWEYFIPSDFDYGYSDLYGGGKFFGGFSGGSVTKIPNNDDTDYDGWMSMLIFQNGNYRTYNYFKNTSYTSAGWPNGHLVANLVKGQWRRITVRLKMNDANAANGYFEVFDNDVLAFSQSGVKVINEFHPEFLIDAIDLNLFFGGGSAPYKSPKSQYMRFDNLIAFYYPKSSSHYRSGASEKGRKLVIPTVIEKCPKSPNHFKTVTLKDKSGYLDSHCGFYQPVAHPGFETAVISPTGASTITIDVKKFLPDMGSTSSSGAQILKIYSGTGTSKKLVRTYDRTNPSLAKHTINASAVTIEWQAGKGFTGGFSLNYTSNGTSSGTDFHCNHKHTALQNGTSTQQPGLSVPASLSLVSKTTTSATIKWTLASGSQTGQELQRLSSTGSVLKTISLNSTTTQYTDSELSANTTYQYRVRSSNGSSYSAYSNTLSVTTSSTTVTPVSMANWPFEEGSGTITKDISGNNRNASLVGGTSFSTDKKFGQYSLKFDGTDDYVNAGAINLGNEFTISMWAKITNSGAKIWTLFANGNSGATQAGLRIGINTYGTSDGKINIMTGNGSAYNDGSSQTGVFELNKWNHLAFCINRLKGTVRIFYNGTDVTSDSLILKDFNNTNTINIGRMLNNSFLFAGNIDDVRLYDRILPKTEILSLFSGDTQQPGLSVPANLSLVSKTTTSATIKWTLASGSQTGQELQRLSSTGSVLKTISLNSTTTQYTDSELSANTTYQYRVRSSNGSSYSAYSNTLSVTTSSTTVTPVSMANWPFEEGSGTITKDISGNNRNASLVGGTSFSTDKKFGQYSLKFDGTDDYVNAGAINLGNEFTISMWAKITNSGAKIWTLFANGNSGATQAGLRIGINTYGTSDRKINIMTGNGSAYNDGGSQTGVFELNKWNHLAFCINRLKGTVRIFYNGTDVTSDSLILKDFNNTNTINIGRMLNNSFLFAGNIDDVRLYGRILSKTEILSLFSGATTPALIVPEEDTTGSVDTVENSDNTSGISKDIETEVLSVFPNPSDGLINLQLNKEVAGPVHISVTDVTGKVIYQKTESDIASSHKIIDLSSQTSGIYFVIIETESNSYTEKLIIR